MFGLFNRKNGFKAALQAYNTLAMCLATYDLINNPQAKFSEVGTDVLIHGVTIYSLRENAGILMQFFASGSNLFRMGSIYTGLILGGSNVPPLLNVVDMGNHFVNTAAGFIANEEASKTDTPSAKMS